MAVTLTYEFAPDAPTSLPYGELQLKNPLFAMLSAIREGGSIGKAAVTLGVSYRSFWGKLKEQELLLGRPLLAGGAGQAARLSAFAESLLWAEKRMLARFLPSAETLAAKLDQHLLLVLEPSLMPLRVAASHDLLFGLLRDQVRHESSVLLDIDYVGSGTALARLNQGSCGLAGIHLPLNDEYLCGRGSTVHAEIGRHLKLGEHKLIRMATREQGFIVERSNPLDIRLVGDLRRPDVRFVNRQAGSGTRVLLDELLRHHQMAASEIHGYDSEEPTHLSVAASVAAGLANCGIGLRAAATQFRLGFVPLITEQYFIVCHKPMLDTEPMQKMLSVLRSDVFSQAASSLPGYSAAGAGEIVSLRGALPWYK